MKSVLIVEDNGVLRKILSSHIDAEDCICVGSYISALDAWETYVKDIQCIILDLSIPAYGLTNDEICRYRPFIGLAFLEKITSGVSEKEKIRIQKMTVIFSAYLEDFKRFIQGNVTAKATTQGVTLIDKGLDPSGQLSTRRLASAANQILNGHE